MSRDSGWTYTGKVSLPNFDKSAEGSTTGPRVWAGGSKNALLALLAGGLLTLFAFVTVDGIDRQRVETLFRQNAADMRLRVEAALEKALLKLRSIESFYHASAFVDRGEFSRFTAPLLSDSGSIQALEWIPRVPHAQRAAAEAAAQADGLVGFQFTERDQQGRMVRRADSPEYFPVYYVEPLMGNETAAGFDLGSSAAQLAALSESRESGAPVATARITLVQEDASQYGFLIFWPVFGDKPKLAAIGSSSGLLGFSLGLLHAGDLLRNSLADQVDTHHQAWLYDLSAPAGQRLLASSTAAIASDGAEPALDEMTTGLHALHRFEMAGREWALLVRPATSFFAAQRNNHAVFIGVLGGLVALLVAAWLQIRDRLSRELRNHNRLLTDQVAKKTAELAASETWHRTLLEGMSEGLVVIDQRGIVQTINPAAERIFGYSPEQLVGQNVHRLMPGSARAMHDRLVAAYADTRESRVMARGRELEGQRADGSRFAVEITLNAIDIDSQHWVVGLVRDVSERRRHELQRQEQLAALERSNRELEQFAYVASHDLQEPLRMVGSYMQLIEQRYVGQLDDDADKWIGYAVDGANRMKALIEDLLVYSRVNAQNMEPVVINAEAVLQSVLCDLRQALDDNDARVTHDPLPWIMADPGQLHQVMLNLIGNALKYHHAERPPAIHLSADRHSGRWRISVRDNGIGIEERFHGKVFAIFQRLHGRDEYSGTGVGLAIVRRIVERHGGRIWIESTPGEGSTFFFTMPAADQPDAGAAPDETDSESPAD